MRHHHTLNRELFRTSDSVRKSGLVGRSAPVEAFAAAGRRSTAIFLLGGILLSLCLSACAPSSKLATGNLSEKTTEIKQEIGQQKRYERVFTDYFDTVTTIILYAANEKEAETMFKLAEDKLVQYHRAFDIYHTYPNLVNIKSLNDRAGQGPVKVEPEVMELLLQGKRANRLSKGAVNPALGPVIRVWKEAVGKMAEATQKGGEPAAFLPDPQQLDKLNQHTDFSQVILDEKAGTVELKDPEMALDVGSGSKGLAAEKLAACLREAGVKAAMLSLGGNVRTIGTKPDGQDWLVGVQNPAAFLPDLLADHSEAQAGAERQPSGGAEEKAAKGEVVKGEAAEDAGAKEEVAADRTQKILLALKARDCAVVTSGSYMRFAVAEGKIYHHIIDPSSLQPENRYDSVTVISPDSGLADSITTALFNLSIEEGQNLAAELPGVEVLWVKGGKLVMTKGFSAYIAAEE